MNIPYWLLRMLPLFEYICPKCRKEVKRNSHVCPRCGEHYPSALRIPPAFLKDKKKLEAYVHEHIFPRVSRFERAYLAQFFTVIFSDGFEPPDVGFSAWTGTVGSPSVVTSNPHSGTYNAKALPTSSSAASYCYKTVNVSTVYARGYFYFTKMPNAADAHYIEVIRFLCGGTGLTGVRVMYVASSGNTILEIFYRNGTTVFFITDSTTTFQINTWYCIELYCLVDPLIGTYSALVNGSPKITIGGRNSANYGNITQTTFGVYTSTLTTETPEVDWDDCVIADTYIGPELQQFTLSGAPAAATKGVPFNSVIVTAKDNQGNICNGYTGTVQWSSTDPLASLPINYTFTAIGDQGTHTFNGFTLNTTGNQTITVTDPTGSITNPGAVSATSGTIVVTSAQAPQNIKVPSKTKIHAAQANSQDMHIP